MMTDPVDKTRAAVQHIASMLQQHGGRALLVGGCVRDALMKCESKDFDLEVYNLSAEDIRRIVGAEYALEPVGMSFGVFKLHHLEIDIALPRRESKTGAGHRGFMVSAIPDLSYAEAAARRDFTVNAIMQDPLTGEIIDPWNGRADLKMRILRHVSSHFAEDPLRVLRAMQFAARFEFTVAPETVRFCAGIRQEELAVERIGTEWEKLFLKGRKPSLGLQFLRDSTWLRYYPELAALSLEDWQHTRRTMDAAALLRTGNDADDLILMAGSLCLHLSDTAGFLARLWRRLDLAARVPALTAALQRSPDWKMPDAALRRLALAVKRLDLFSSMAEADMPEFLPEIRMFRERAARLGVLHAPPEPLILGRDLLERGAAPGPEMGKVLQECFAAQLDGVFSDRPGGLQYLATRLNDGADPRHR